MQITFDTETCGFHGPIVLLQYSIDNQEEVVLYEPWYEPVGKTLEFYEWIANNTVVGFNLTFDWFHLCQQYGMFSNLPPSVIPRDLLDSDAGKQQLIDAEKAGRDCKCLKPYDACDVMLQARKTEYQSTMNRKDIHIRRVPYDLAQPIADYLEREIQFKDIYFAKRAKPQSRRWVVEDTDDPEFKDIVVRFKPSSGLKALASEILGGDPNKFNDIAVDKCYTPNEFGWAPYAEAVMRAKNLPDFKWKGAWPAYIEYHLSHWRFNEAAREYAKNDVIFTRQIGEHLGVKPGDDDSILACAVGANRWKGLALDLPLLDDLIARTELSDVPTDSNAVKKWIWPDLSENERVFTKGSTAKIILEELSTWEDHPAASKASEVLKARKAKYRLDNLRKLRHAERFHLSYDVLGTKSSRMSGAGAGLNSQGIEKDKELRSCFTLAPDDMHLVGGDFDAFEVSIFDAVVQDPGLHEALLKDKKFHAIFGTYLYDEEDYDSIVASSGTEEDLYTKSKSGLFAIFYGGNEHTLEKRLGIPVEKGQYAIQNLLADYPGIFEYRAELEKNYLALQQERGIGSKITWQEPAKYIESLMGFRRYFDVEWLICRKLYDLGQKPPKFFKVNRKVYRKKDREQTVSGAARSAIFAAAFSLQADIFRAAANHQIQATGATLTKKLQRRLWDLQPHGANEWQVMLMNSHDELMSPCKDPEVVNARVHETIDELRSIVPLLKIDWKELDTWADV